MFILDARIEKDTSYISNHDIFQIRLMLDKRYFWLVVVPEISDIVEWHDLKQKTSNELNKLMTISKYPC